MTTNLSIDSQKPLRYYRFWFGFGVFLVAAVAVLTLIPPKDYQLIIPFDWNDKVSHFLAYSVLTGWFACLSLGRRLFIPTVFFLLLGTLLECAQLSSAYRMFDRYDLLANWVGVAVGITLMFTPLRLSLAWFERRVLKV